MALGMTPSILQVVGYKNSGKTTVVSNIIQFASEHGYNLGAIKHHGHGGPPNLAEEMKDSDRHLRAGALMSAVEGGGKLQLVAQKTTWQLKEILLLYQKMDIDCILVEGYKRAHYPKIVLLRQKEDLALLDKVEEIVAVIHDHSIAKTDIPYQSFLFAEKELYCLWFLDFLRS